MGGAPQDRAGLGTYASRLLAPLDRDKVHNMKRKKISMQVVREVLTESGYKCAVPTCRNILAIDIHHMVQVSEGGANVLSNLLALCPNCHSLHHKHIISRDSIYAWKLMLVSLSRAFDTNAMDDLLFLKQTPPKKLQISGDGVLKFSRLIGGGLAEFKLTMQNGPIVLYNVHLTQKGAQLVDAWMSGNREKVALALGRQSSKKRR